jgi:hypothetical protein
MAARRDATPPSLGGASGKRMRLRYAGRCRLCGAELPVKTEAVYERGTRTVRCLSCSALEQPAGAADEAGPCPTGDGGTAAPVEAGVAGLSARREYERRRARDEARIRVRWGRLGGIVVALSEERQSTSAWERGAGGEERLGARLDSLASSDVMVLHDRRIPGTRANFDHIAVTRGGVWVIDAKRYRGRPQLKVEGGFFRPRVEKVLVGRRDCTKLVDAVLKHVDLVRDVVGEVPVVGALCFVEADWPLVGGSFTTRGVHVLWPRRLATLLVDEPAGGVDVAALHEVLASRFPPA